MVPRVKHSKTEYELALSLHAQGIGYREIGRRIGASHNTTRSWCLGLGKPEETWTPEEEMKRIQKIIKAQLGEKAHNWVGAQAKKRTGNGRARRLYKCPLLDWMRLVRHHVNGDTLNNRPENIAFITTKEHLEVNGIDRRPCDLNLPLKILVKRIMLYRLGYNDQAIAEVQGFGSAHTISNWRHNNRLLMNTTNDLAEEK